MLLDKLLLKLLFKLTLLRNLLLVQSKLFVANELGVCWNIVGVL